MRGGAINLGLVHRGVGVAQDLCRVTRILRNHLGHADTRGEAARDAGDIQRCGEGGMQSLGKAFQRGVVGVSEKQCDELVSAVAGDQVLGAQGGS